MRNRIRDNRTRPTGFSFIGILLVIVIICILVGYYFGQDPLDKTHEQINTYQYTTGRAKDVVQGENLRVFQQKVDLWAISHPGQRCTLDGLRAAGISYPPPPAGQKYEIDADNKVRLVSADETNPMSVRGVPTSPGLP